jgi:hypothetical protein
VTAGATLAIRAATLADRAVVVRLFAAAHADSQVGCWLVSDAAARHPCSLGLVAVDVDQALQHGLINLASADRGEIIGAALWLSHPSPAGQQSEPPTLGPAGGDRGDDMRAVLHRRRHLERLRQLRHPWRVHHHLAHFAVTPDQRGHGSDDQLLLYHHAYLHVLGIPAYLEADSPDSHDLFHRHGYTCLGPPVLLPGTGIPLWPMWRPPGPPTIGPGRGRPVPPGTC